MAPPTNAVVFSMDEKSQIQALQHAQPLLPMDLGQPERRTHNYIRHGTLDLFAALNVATGEVLTRCTAQHRAQDFVALLWTLTRVSSRRSNSTSCSTISPCTKRRPSNAGWFVLPPCTFISHRRMRRG